MGGVIAGITLAKITALDLGTGSEPALFHPGKNPRHSETKRAGHFACTELGGNHVAGVEPFAERVDFLGRQRIETTRSRSDFIQGILLADFQAIKETVGPMGIVALPKAECGQHRAQFAFAEHGVSFALARPVEL